MVHSSNIGIVKIAHELPYTDLFNTLRAVGFGQSTGQLPGEISGVLAVRDSPIEHATLSYGYGISVTPLQLARAYTVFASGGKLLEVTLLPKPHGYHAPAKRVFSASTVQTILPMLERAASNEGTARKAQIPRYRVGGKTGTVHKFIDGAYHDDRYQSVFVGLAPLSAPKFVIAVTIDDPRGELYFGGDVAAPVFAEIMADLMRLYNIAPDAAIATNGSAI